ncbi:MAG: adenylate/guanylate cyclase domain-containing protein [Gammaproteobacteria bacterium]|nr:adenylate/guanylate cyclase domain-containing protein [Gammaproteobacteria bacterium]
MSASRKLLTVFYADVAGYSRLTGVDEEGTHRRVMAILDHATNAIGTAGGTVLRYAGDAILASFPSVVKAVETSVTIQNDLAETNQSQADQDPVHIRIGINQGDVLEDRGEVFGEGVNLAARLESAAQAGGICISSLVHGQVNGKVDVEFHDGGEVSFKNIKEPTRVYYWAPEGLPQPVLEAETKPGDTRRKPAIAVLPLSNMSNDPEQEHFADGLTEDLITALSRKRWYDVAARNSTFAYKGQAVSVLQEVSGLNYLKNLFLSACYTSLGDDQKAQVAISYVLQAVPNLRLNDLGFCKGFRDAEVRDRITQTYKRAGLPLD